LYVSKFIIDAGILGSIPFQTRHARRAAPGRGVGAGGRLQAEEAPA
jgi:hypothetical protein